MPDAAAALATNCCQICLKADSKKALDALQNFVFRRVIKSASVQQLEFKGQQMVLAVFQALMSDPSTLLPSLTYKKFKEDGEDRRVVCDHIAGMTDHYLLRSYERLFSPRMGSVFDQL